MREPDEKGSALRLTSCGAASVSAPDVQRSSTSVFAGIAGISHRPLPRIRLHLGMWDMATLTSGTGRGVTSAPRDAHRLRTCRKLPDVTIWTGHAWQSPSLAWPGTSARSCRRWLTRRTNGRHGSGTRCLPAAPGRGRARRRSRAGEGIKQAVVVAEQEQPVDRSGLVPGCLLLAKPLLDGRRGSGSP